MANKMTLTQSAVGFAIGVTYIWGSTAIVWRWPETSPRIMNSFLALAIAGLALWGYLVSRKTNPPA